MGQTMHKIEPIKRIVEKATGIGVPSSREALERRRRAKPLSVKFRPDGYIPNNPSVPLLYYRKAVNFPKDRDSAAMLEAIFNSNGWGDAWRNGIYDFVHYHPRIHEVLGVARGLASLRLGGNKGRTVKVGTGDVLLIPAGVGHECLKASTDFLVVGAYPSSGVYSECRGSYREYEKTRSQIRRVAGPSRNPLFGKQ